MVRYMRTTKALGLELIQVKSASGTTTTRKLNAMYNQEGDILVVVGTITDCEDAEQITFNLPSLTSVWNICKGERAIVSNAALLTYMDWGRSRKAGATTRSITIPEAHQMLSEGRWTPEKALGPGVNITMAVMDRSFKEQIGVEALMLLATPVC